MYVFGALETRPNPPGLHTPQSPGSQKYVVRQKNTDKICPLTLTRRYNPTKIGELKTPSAVLRYCVRNRSMARPDTHLLTQPDDNHTSPGIGPAYRMVYDRNCVLHLLLGARKTGLYQCCGEARWYRRTSRPGNHSLYSTRSRRSRTRAEMDPWKYFN